MKLVISLFYLRKSFFFALCLSSFPACEVHVSDSYLNKPANSKSAIHEDAFNKKENVINEEYSSAVVQIASLKGKGTAFFISPDTLVTNFHVISDLTNREKLVEDQLFVKVSDEDWLPVESIVALDILYDLAVLKIKDFASPHYISLEEAPSSSKEIQTAGFPGGLFNETKGSIFYDADTFIYINMKEKMGPGASGSPVLFKNGALAGVLNAINVFSKNNLAVPVNRLKELLAKRPLNCRSAVCVTKEWERIQALADQSHPQAQFNLAMMYRDGNGVNQDYEKAFYWFQRSAVQGFPQSQYNLAVMYFEAKGVDQSFEKAFYWFQKSADQGHPHAQHDLAVMYFSGYGVDQSFEKAFYWFQKSAVQAYPKAQYHLAVMYFNGYGVDQNVEKAFYWFQKSADQAHPQAQYNLAVMYFEAKGVDQSFEKAFYWFQKSAVQGHPHAQHDLAVMYFSGYGVDQSFEKAFDWLKKSAAQGNLRAQDFLKNDIFQQFTP